jgi:hypothetical protein
VVAAWLDGRTPPDLVPAGEVVPMAASGESLLVALLKLRVLDPVEFDRVPHRTGPEFAYLRGERAAAADGYAARLRALPHDVASWAGLGLALDSAALRRVPELVRAVHRDVAVRTGTAPAPLRLIAWFDRAMARPAFTGDI